MTCGIIQTCSIRCWTRLWSILKTCRMILTFATKRSNFEVSHRMTMITCLQKCLHPAVLWYNIANNIIWAYERWFLKYIYEMHLLKFCRSSWEELFVNEARSHYTSGNTESPGFQKKGKCFSRLLLVFSVFLFTTISSSSRFKGIVYLDSFALSVLLWVLPASDWWFERFSHVFAQMCALLLAGHC